MLTMKNGKGICIFSGSSNRKLASEICSTLGVSLGHANIEYFANSEARPVISDSVREQNVFVIQTGAKCKVAGVDRSVNDMLMETLLLVDACKRSGCKHVTLLLPCYPYARQDKKDSARAAISARVVANMIKAIGAGAVKRIVCVELHNPCIQGFFDISVDNLYTMDLIVDFLRSCVFPEALREWAIEHPEESYDFKKQYVVVAPDEGGFKRASVFADKLKLPFLGMSKTRDYSQKNYVSKSVILGDHSLLHGKTALILDDMIDTCGTCIKTVEALSAHGIKNVIVCATHGILSDPAIDRINACDLIKCVVVSDSLDQTDNATACSKLRVFSLAKLYAEVIKRLVERRSISEMFD